MRNQLLGLSLLVCLFMACEKNTSTNTPTDPTGCGTTTLSHDIFDRLLQRYVNAAGNVDYAGFKNEQDSLSTYLDILKCHAPESTWSANKEMAYWINLYNAFTIHEILTAYPVSSIMNIDNGMIWDTKTISIGGTDYTLNQIEKNQLLAKFNEAKVHFAVNCAAASCPPLLNRAWTEQNIQQNYDDQTRAFINNSAYNTITQNSLEVSEIFNWYASDFGGSNQIVSYFQQYSTTTIDNNATVQFKTYDWSLNKQ